MFVLPLCQERIQSVLLIHTDCHAKFLRTVGWPWAIRTNFSPVNHSAKEGAPFSYLISELSGFSQDGTILLSCDTLSFSSGGVLLTGRIPVVMTDMLKAAIQSSYGWGIWQSLNSLYNHVYRVDWFAGYIGNNSFYQSHIKQVIPSAGNSDSFHAHLFYPLTSFCHTENGKLGWHLLFLMT